MTEAWRVRKKVGSLNYQLRVTPPFPRRSRLAPTTRATSRRSTRSPTSRPSAPGPRTRRRRGGARSRSPRAALAELGRFDDAVALLALILEDDAHELRADVARLRRGERLLDARYAYNQGDIKRAPASPSRGR